MPDYNLYDSHSTTQTYPLESDFFGSGDDHFNLDHEMASLYSGDDMFNSHGLDFPVVGGNIDVGPSVAPELAAAAYDENKAVLMHEGEAFLAPFDAINTDAVELACNDDGCVLIPDDNNPHNDLYVHGM